MRRNLALLGVAVATVGAVLLVLPFPHPYDPYTFWENPHVEPGEDVSAPAVPGGVNQRIEFTATWSTNGTPAFGPGGFRLFDCGFVASCTPSVFGNPPKLYATGASGSVSWSAGPGELFQLAPSAGSGGGNVTVAVSYTEPLIGGLAGLPNLVGGGALACVAWVSPPLTRAKSVEPIPP